MPVIHGRSLVVTRHGDSSVLAVEDRPVAGPAPGQLLVRVAASGINFIEVYQREGKYPIPTPFVSGGEGAGWVVETGADVVGFAPGDVVAWADAPGSHSDFVMVPADRAVPVPSELDPVVAGGALLQGVTAHYLVNSTYPVQPGDSVVVHAAAGGVGQLLVQLCKARGAFVVATASTEAKLAKARASGADELISYADHPDAQTLAGRLRGANREGGFSVVFDGVGQSTFMASLMSVAPRGMMVLFGASSGPVEPFDPQLLNRFGSLYLTRPTMGNYLATREELLWRGTEVLAALADGGLVMEIGGRYPLEAAAQAYDDLQGRRTSGKLLLTR